MSQNNEEYAPDLATILRNISAYAAPQAKPEEDPLTSWQDGQQNLPQQQVHAVNSNASITVSTQGYDPLQPHQTAQIVQEPEMPLTRSYDPRLLPQHRSATQTPEPLKISPIDPATITEWAIGLRCVSSVASKNPNFATIIQRMIANQRKHEEQWWKSRQDLLEKHTARFKGAAQLNDVLKSLSAISAVESEEELKEKNATELSNYDLKVYRAATQMEKEMSGEMKKMGVPFFGVRPELIADGDGQEESDDKKKITREELLSLQRRMIAYLEDMYKN